METLVGYRDPCNICDALCCKTHPIYDSRVKTYPYIEIKVAGEVCRNLDLGQCKIYETRQTEGFGDCSEYSCLGIGPIVQKWMLGKSIPLYYGGMILDIVRQYFTALLKVHNQGEFESLSKEVYQDGLRSIEVLISECPDKVTEIGLYWQCIQARLY